MLEQQKVVADFSKKVNFSSIIFSYEAKAIHNLFGAILYWQTQNVRAP